MLGEVCRLPLQPLALRHVLRRPHDRHGAPVLVCTGRWVSHTCSGVPSRRCRVTSPLQPCPSRTASKTSRRRARSRAGIEHLHDVAPDHLVAGPAVEDFGLRVPHQRQRRSTSHTTTARGSTSKSARPKGACSVGSLRRVRSPTVPSSHAPAAPTLRPRLRRAGGALEPGRGTRPGPRRLALYKAGNVDEARRRLARSGWRAVRPMRNSVGSSAGGGSEQRPARSDGPWRIAISANGHVEQRQGAATVARPPTAPTGAGRLTVPTSRPTLGVVPA